jgi:hypothetical protein
MKRNILVIAGLFLLTLASCSEQSNVTPSDTTTAAARQTADSIKKNTTKVAVTQANLLSAISTYLTTNYAGYTFLNAYSETSNNVLTGYDVNITYNSVNYHVTFDATGTFISVGTRKAKTPTTNVPVAQADLLATIQTYLTTNYAGYTFVNAYSEAVSGVIANYDVNIISNAVTYHVVFDAMGVFVSVGTKGNGGGKKKGH